MANEKKKKIVGISYGYNAGDEYKMVTDIGIDWIRVIVPYPWSDKMYGKLTKDYSDIKKDIIAAHEHGLKIFPFVPGMGGYFYDKKQKKTVFMESFPDFMGKKGTKEFYDNVKESIKFIANDLKEYADDLWQTMNEIDISTFTGEYTDDIVTTVARVSAEAIMELIPNARVGINLAHFEKHSLEMADLAYRKGHKFSYIGIDGYFGSWQCWTVENWTQVVDLLYDRYKLPVVVAEWGYSSGGVVTAIMPDPEKIPKGWMDVCVAKAWFHEVPGGHNEETQAEYFRRGLELFSKNPKVIANFLFCWKDSHTCYHCGQTECPAECFWGIVDEHCKPKKAYYAIKDAIAKYY
jgi:hypothetical protein